MTTQINLQTRLQTEISVLIEQPGNPELWDQFVQKHPYGSPFHLMAWQRMLQKTFGHEPHHLVARSVEGDVVGVLPLFLVRSRIFGPMLVSTPHAAYGGPIASSDAAKEALLHRACMLAKDLNVEFLELRNFRNECKEPCLVVKDLYVTFRQELYEDPEKSMLAIPRKTRAEIREGIRHGLEFKVDEISPRRFFDVYSRNLRDLGTPAFPPRLFEIGASEFGNNCKIFSVHRKQNLVSAVWTLFYKNEVVPYFGASIREYNHLAVNNFMYWRLIKYGWEHGYKIFDFGRSKKATGSFAFKKRWGMQMTDLSYQYFLVRKPCLPDTSPLNPKFALAIRLWRRLPLSITNRVGPAISMHLV